jgi:hypothetical protein
MCSAIAQPFRDWGLDELLAKYVELRIRPSASESTLIGGRLSFRVVAPRGEVVEDEYDIELQVPPSFPHSLPTVYETAKRVPREYHKLEGNALCLGAPIAIRLRLATAPSLLTLVDEFVVPYLAGYSHFVRNGTMLFGELAHGPEGIRQYLRELFQAGRSRHPEQFVFLASRRKRSANKLHCPCGSGRRLGKCHNRSVNSLRTAFGRRFFAVEYQRLLSMLF